MKSSSGKYYVGLDHIRALAAFLVFVWHFYEVDDGHFSGPLVFPLSLLTEGHVGVALFMCLSGYLFAKLLEGKAILYVPFLWNRAIRLFPLLIVTFVLSAINFIYFVGWTPELYLRNIIFGFVQPTWPNGGWSIAVELHFYILLPVLLFLSAKRPSLILLAILCSVAFRCAYWASVGQVQMLAYWTIVGGIDYFVFGIYAFKSRAYLRGNHALGTLCLMLLAGFIYLFDQMGGFYGIGSYPTASPIWIIYPTVVGALTASAIAWYDTSFEFAGTGVSGFIARIGECSYSIYLLHFFVVFRISDNIDERIVSLEDDYMALVFATVSFLIFVPVARVSFRYIELPALRYRRSYVATPDLARAS